MRDSYDHGILKPLTMLGRLRAPASRRCRGWSKTAPRAWSALGVRRAGRWKSSTTATGLKLPQPRPGPGDLAQPRLPLRVLWGVSGHARRAEEPRELEIYAHEVDGKPQLRVQLSARAVKCAGRAGAAASAQVAAGRRRQGEFARIACAARGCALLPRSAPLCDSFPSPGGSMLKRSLFIAAAFGLFVVADAGCKERRSRRHPTEAAEDTPKKR